eukprot:EG_transcript_34454
MSAQQALPPTSAAGLPPTAPAAVPLLPPKSFYGGREQRAVLGIEVLEQDDPATGGIHLTVVDLTPGGPAEEAGLKKGDIIMRWDDTPVLSKADFARMVQLTGVGAHVVLQVVRQPRHGLPNTTTTIIEYFKVITRGSFY